MAEYMHYDNALEGDLHAIIPSRCCPQTSFLPNSCVKGSKSPYSMLAPRFGRCDLSWSTFVSSDFNLKLLVVP
jgi:hypothetical protein